MRKEPITTHKSITTPTAQALGVKRKSRGPRAACKSRNKEGEQRGGEEIALIRGGPSRQLRRDIKARGGEPPSWAQTLFRRGKTRQKQEDICRVVRNALKASWDRDQPSFTSGRIRKRGEMSGSHAEAADGIQTEGVSRNQDQVRTSLKQPGE